MSPAKTAQKKPSAKSFTVVKRNGHLVSFQPERIERAIEAGFSRDEESSLRNRARR